MKPDTRQRRAAIRLRSAALAFAKRCQMPVEDDNDAAGTRANRRLMAAALEYARATKRMTQQIRKKEQED